MIQIFRRIRKRLLTENKLSKYLLYALGEIVLVVIGILIALNINNWNQERQDSEKELAYIENLKRDLQDQLSSIDVQMTYEKRYLELGTPILEEYRKTNVILFDSSLSRNLATMMERKTFVRTDPTFEDLISSGNIGALKNADFRNRLIAYYQELKRIEKVVQNNNTLHVDESYAHEIQKLVAVGGRTTDRLLSISRELLKDPEREMMVITMLDYRIHISEIHLGMMHDLRKTTEEIIEHIQTCYP